jgi:hypothetical protein
MAILAFELSKFPHREYTYNTGKDPDLMYLTWWLSRKGGYEGIRREEEGRDRGDKCWSTSRISGLASFETSERNMLVWVMKVEGGYAT